MLNAHDYLTPSKQVRDSATPHLHISRDRQMLRHFEINRQPIYDVLGAQLLDSVVTCEKSSFVNLICVGRGEVHLFSSFQLMEGINKGYNLQESYQSKTKEKDWR